MIPFEAYLEQAEQNLLRMSRTANGIIDVSASSTKADYMKLASGKDAGEAALANFRAALRMAYGEKDRVFSSAEQVRQFVTDIALRVNEGIIRDFAEGTTALHGDIQPANVMVTDEVMLYIDMDTLSYGNPELDLVYLYNALVAFSYIRPNADFFGMDDQLSMELWEKFFRRYFADRDEAFMEDREKIYKALGFCRVYRWALRHIPDRADKLAVLRTLFEDAVRAC